MPKYLSPTSLTVWEKDQEEFYLRYLADQRPPKFPQTQPMAVGSAFDAYIKAYYHEKLFGKNNDPRFVFEAIFEDQVEPQNRDWALVAGEHAFNCYKESGSCADLLVDLLEAPSAPRFEFTLKETIQGVPLLGKPDLSFFNRGKGKGPVEFDSGVRIILDWKVNGYCSKYPKSPNRGYMIIRDGWDYKKFSPSRNAGDMHKDCHPMQVNGVRINIQEFMETISKEWGLQLSTYAWLLGAEVGSEFIVAIDQLCCDARTDPPKIRIAEHRCQIGVQYQEQVIARYRELWTIINSGHIFRSMSAADSAGRCEILDEQHKAFEGDDDFIKQMTGRAKV
jgi:hypothetical protein